MRKSPDHSFESWPIVRTKPGGKKYGRSIRLFINNWQCHLATVDVYEDGAIDCWGFVDRSIFRDKVASRWPVARPQRDQHISVFHFGHAEPVDGAWFHDGDDILRAVDLELGRLNPEGKDLVDMQGSDTEPRGKVRYAKMGLSDKKSYRRDIATGNEILGEIMSILIPEEDGFCLSRLTVFTDGFITVGQDDTLHGVGRIESMFESEKLATKAPQGSLVKIPGLGRFTTANDFGGLSPRDVLGELHNKLGILSGKDNIVSICARAYEEYEAAPSEILKEKLRVAYENVPTHLRMYCGDMDTRDHNIRRVLYDGEG